MPAKIRRRQTARPDIGFRSSGVKAADYVIDETDASSRAIDAFRRTNEIDQRRRSQVIEFDTDRMVGLANLADIHAGGTGVDYPRLFSELELINSTPGLFVATVGDMVDNYILTKLAFVQRDNPLSIGDEWAITRRVLNLIAPRHVLAVGGNHDAWTTIASGVDYFGAVLSAVSPETLYDTDDSRVTIKIGDRRWPGRLRHKWSGHSIYNPTHGIERGFLFDHDFAWGVGAHTHVSGLARTFNASGENGLAVLCGTYKRIDDYARVGGFPKPNRSTAVVILFDPATGGMVGIDNLATAAEILTAVYR